jgi:hypothetical protein
MPPCARSTASRSAHPPRDQAVGIDAVGERAGAAGQRVARADRDLDLDVGLDAQLERVHRRLVARAVAVVEQHDALGQPLEHVDLLDRQRGAERRHHLGEPSLVQRDDVEVALDEHAAPGGRHPRAWASPNRSLLFL